MQGTKLHDHPQAGNRRRSKAAGVAQVLQALPQTHCASRDTVVELNKKQEGRKTN